MSFYIKHIDIIADLDDELDSIQIYESEAPQTVIMWEVGKREATFDTLDKLADYFQVPIDYLLGRSDDRSEKVYQEDFIKRVLGTDRKYDELLYDIKMLDDYGFNLIEKVVSVEKQRCFEMDSLRNPLNGGLMKLKGEER